MARQGDNTTLTDRLREMLLDFVEQAASGPQDLEYGREWTLYVLELMQPTLEALEDERYLDCVRYLDEYSLDVARQGVGFLINIVADRLVRAARRYERADLVRGWAHRARGYVDLAQQDPGKARRRFRWALRYGHMAQDSTLIGAALLSIGVSFHEQNDKRQARQIFEKALPYARSSDEPWVLAYVATDLALLMGPDEAERAEELYEESLRARGSSHHEMSRVPVLTNLGILRSEQGRYSEAEKLFREALRLDMDGRPIDDEPIEVFDPREVLLPLQNLANVLAEQRRFSEATNYYENALELAEQLGDSIREGQLRMGLAVCLANAEEFERSHDQFALLAESSQRFGISEERAALVVRDLGITAMRIGRLEEAVSHFRSARNRYEVLNHKPGVASTLLDEAAALKTENPEAQIELIRDALKVLKGTRHHDAKLEAYDRLVRALFEELRLREAIGAFAEQRRLLRRLQRIQGLARRLAEVGSVFADFRVHGRAIRAFRQAADLYEQLQDQTGWIQSRNDLANRLVEVDRMREAEEIYLTNLARARRLENRVLQVYALLNLGQLCSMEDRTNEALSRLREANELSRELHDLGGLAIGLNNLGLALEQTGELEQAKHAFEQSLETATRAHDEPAMARAWSSLGTAAFDQGAYEEAQEAYQRAVSLATQSGDKGLQAEMLLNSAAAARELLGFSIAEQLIEQSVNVAQEVLHYDTAYDATAQMTQWLVLDGDMEKAGEWSAYALLFGPLLSSQVDRWASWLVTIMSTISSAEDRRVFVQSMAATCRHLENENNLDGQLLRAVETVRTRLI